MEFIHVFQEYLIVSQTYPLVLGQKAMHLFTSTTVPPAIHPEKLWVWLLLGLIPQNAPCMAGIFMYILPTISTKSY